MRTFLGISFSVFLGACATQLPEPRPVLVDSVAESGETHISVLSVESWKTARSALNVKFEVDAATALQEAIPRTSTYEERLLDIFAANLKVGLPRSSVSDVTKTDAAGKITQTSSVTRSDGAVPGDDVIPAPTSPDVNSLPGLEAAERTAALSGNDPLLKYQTARTIKQYVTVLDRVIDNTPQIDGYDPYLVTLQVTSFPYSKHQPYDVYLDLSFFPKRAHQGIAAPVIYPVLITDNLEGQSVSRAAELVRQIGLAADVLSSGFAGTLGLSSFNARAGAVFGTDLTSTFTVGKSSENSMTVVLGAARNPVSDYAMIRRTHNVSVLMMLPKAISDMTGNNRAVDVLTTTELRRPDQKSAPLKLRTANDNAMKTAIDLARARGIGGGLSDDALSGLIKNAWASVTGGDYQSFNQVAKAQGYGHPQALFHTVSDVFGKSPNFKTTAIPLPAKPKTPKPAEFCIDYRTASAFDDPNAGEMRVVLTGATGVRPKDLTATLTLVKGRISYPFVATKTEMSGGKLVMVFPSAARAGLSKVSPGGGSLRLGTAANACPPIRQDRTSQVVYTVAPKIGTKAPGTAAKPAAAQISADGKGGLAINLTTASKSK